MRGIGTTCGLLVVAACGSNAPPPIGEVAPAQCPAFLDLELDGAASRFDPGFTGLAHGVGLETGSRLTVEVFGCDADCRRCQIRGPVRADPAVNPVISQRCLNGIAQTCATDDECAPGTGPCRFIFPPVQGQTINLPVCSIVYFEPVPGVGDGSPEQGVVDLVTGENDLQTLSINILPTINEACVDCMNDPMPNDGVADGTCAGSATKCDVNGIGTVIPSSTSYDCAPTPSTVPPIKLATNGTATSPVQWVLDDTRPKCTAGGGMTTTEPCFCGVCASNGAPCFADRDCPEKKCGDPNRVVKNNNCDAPNMNDACIWDAATQTGHCKVDTKVPCFPDGKNGQTLIANGFAEVHEGFTNVQLSNLVCLPSFGNNLIDFISGFPGPFLFQAKFHVTPRGGT